MSSERAPVSNPFTGTDVAEILRERGWAAAEMSSSELDAWCERAAALLGPHAADRAALADLLALIFSYDAAAGAATRRKPRRPRALRRPRCSAPPRFLLLDGRPLDSERFKEIINVMKEGSDLRSRDLFLPIRLALAGRAGDGELDRIVLLLDEAATLPFAVPVKSARARILEFCPPSIRGLFVDTTKIKETMVAKTCREKFSDEALRALAMLALAVLVEIFSSRISTVWFVFTILSSLSIAAFLYWRHKNGL